MYNSRYNDTQANTSILWILGGKQIVCMEFMRLVGYSNNLQKTWNRMQYYGGKIFGEKHRSREMHKEREIHLALGLRVVVLLVVVLVLPLRLRFYRNVNKHKEQ